MLRCYASACSDRQSCSLGQGESGQRLQPEMSTDMWAAKPAWCQPWTILGTGTGVIAGVYALSHGSPVWVTLASLPVTAWWFVFLVAAPASYREYVEEVLAVQAREGAQTVHESLPK